MASAAEVAQLVVNGAMAGTILAVPAIGLTAIYAVLRFPNFAIASHATIGAFAGYVANVTLHWPVLPSLIAAFVIAGVVGAASDEFVLKRFRPAGYITTAIASIALTIFAATTCRSRATSDSAACESARSNSRISPSQLR